MTTTTLLDMLQMQLTIRILGATVTLVLEVHGILMALEDVTPVIILARSWILLSAQAAEAITLILIEGTGGASVPSKTARITEFYPAPTRDPGRLCTVVIVSSLGLLAREPKKMVPYRITGWSRMVSGVEWLSGKLGLITPLESPVKED